MFCPWSKYFRYSWMWVAFRACWKVVWDFCLSWLWWKRLARHFYLSWHTRVWEMFVSSPEDRVLWKQVYVKSQFQLKQLCTIFFLFPFSFSFFFSIPSSSSFSFLSFSFSFFSFSFSCSTHFLKVHNILTVHSADGEMVPCHIFGERMFELLACSFWGKKRGFSLVWKFWRSICSVL